MKVRMQPELRGRYSTKIAQGKTYPLADHARYLASTFEHDASGRLLTDDKGLPLSRPIDTFVFYLGMPLPSVIITGRIPLSFTKLPLSLRASGRLASM